MCNDGSCAQGYEQETLDEEAASRRLATLLADGLDLDWYENRR